VKLRFLIALLSTSPNWFIPLPILLPYRSRKAKICEDQALETKLQTTFNQGKLLFLSTHQLAKGCKKFKWQVQRDRKTLSIYWTSHAEAEVQMDTTAWKDIPHSLRLCYSPDHEHNIWAKQPSYVSMVMLHITSGIL